MGLTSFAIAAKGIFKEADDSAFFDFLDDKLNKILQDHQLGVMNRINVHQAIDRFLEDASPVTFENLVLIRIYFNSYVGNRYRDMTESQQDQFNLLIKQIEDYTHDRIAHRTKTGPHQRSSTLD